MTGLLVSVRNASEAEAALAGGATLIDIKEPRHGSLGAADEATQADIVSFVAGRVPTSAAWGELRDWNAATRCHVPLGLQFAKLGLADCGSSQDWPQRWSQWADSLATGVQAVAVVYADWRTCGAPSPEQILEAATQLTTRCGAVLVDTYAKQRGDLLACWTAAELDAFISQARAARLLSVVAGSLSLASLEKILPLSPNYVAVRGAVCRGGRSGTLDPRRVRDWVAHLGLNSPLSTSI